MLYPRSIVIRQNSGTHRNLLRTGKLAQIHWEPAMTFAAAIDEPAVRTVRRAPKERTATQVFHQVDPYAALMACWVAYMRVDDRDLGSRGMKLIGEGDSGRDVHEAQHLADLKTGEAVNAMVDSLTVQHRWAIYRSQGISTAWRFQNANYVEVLTAARDALEEKLKKNLATRTYFS